MAVTFTLAVPGVVPENISPDEDATVTDESKVNFKLLEEVIVVPLSRVIEESLELKTVTVPLAGLPTSFLPVAGTVTLPSSSTEISCAAITAFLISVELVGEKVTEEVFSSDFESIKIVTNAFVENNEISKNPKRKRITTAPIPA